MLKIGIQFVLELLVRLLSHIYTIRFHQWFTGKRNGLYSLWIRNFIGEVGDNTSFERPILLQGGGQQRIRIGSNVSIGHHCILGCWLSYGKDEIYNPSIIIGDNCSIGEYCHITAVDSIVIGNGLLTGRFVYIGDNAHGSLSIEEASIPPVRRHLTSKGKVLIGNNVWLGDRVSVFGGVTIGDNVIIGAGSIVTDSIPPNCLAVGAPAKIVKRL